MPRRLPKGVTVERDGPLLRFHGFTFGGFIGYRDLGGIDWSELDDLIARQVRAFAGVGERFEWKYHGHDLPADLPDRLHAAGFVPEETETVVIAPVAQIAAEPHLPDGVLLQEVSGRADLERIEQLQQAVWQDEDLGIADFLEAERSVDPDLFRIFVAVADGSVVSAAWVRFEANTDFAPPSGAVRRPRAGAAAGSIGPWSRIARTWLRSGASGTSRSMPPTTAGRSSSAWVSCQSRRRPRTSGLRPRPKPSEAGSRN
jgi:hypothetical protein